MAAGGGGAEPSATGPCDVELVPHLRCHRCSGELICSARVPHSFLRDDGVEVRGFRTVGLCPVCDQGREGAAEVLDHFREHGRVDEGRVDEVARLLRTWLGEIGPARVDTDALTRLSRSGVLPDS